jgi:hypothetical protein
MPARARFLVAASAGLTLIAMAALAGCSASGASSSAGVAGPHTAANGPAAASGAIAEPAVVQTAVAAPGAKSAASAFSAASGAEGGQDTSATRLVPTGQQLIYTAELTVRARDVGAAVSLATSIAAAAGGYVSSEHATTDPSHPSQSTATVALKIPVAVYAATLAQLSGSALGTQLSRQQQAQDVTEQVADVNSQVASDEAAISQLRALLSRAGSVGDLLSVQDQINAEESDLEAMQAEQSALNHETAFATVTITITGPAAAPKPKQKPKPPPGLAAGLSGGWHAFRVAVSWLLAIIGAVAPFAAVVAVLGFAAYRVRRWLIARGRVGGAGHASGADSAGG